MDTIPYKNILVTGGAGYIGSRLVIKLLEKGYRVTVVDDLSEGSWSNLPDDPNLAKHKASILDNISKFVKGQEVIFHLAAVPWPKMSLQKPEFTHKVNVDGTLNVLLWAKKHKVKKFIFSSTYLVFPKPLVPYSLHKLIGEEYCKLFFELWGLETISLRYFNVYGPGMKSSGSYANLLPKFIKMMSQNKNPTVNGSGKQARDFVHVSDVVSANIAALESSSSLSGKTFNIGTGRLITINEVVKMINHLMGTNIKPAYSQSAIEPGKVSIPKNGVSLLPGWKSKINLEKGLKELIK